MVQSGCALFAGRGDVHAGPPLVGTPGTRLAIRHCCRLAHEQTELAGHTFSAGDGVALLFGSANRDPEAFPDAERFDITRYVGQQPAKRHLTFSLGIHYCLGAPLARLEMEAVLQELIRRETTMTLLTDDLAYRKNLVLRGIERFPVRFQ